MSRFELEMRYSTPPMRYLVRTLALLFPLWGVILPVALALFIFLLLRLPANIPLISSLSIICTFVFLSVGCLVVALISDDDKIRVSKDGLTFPLRFWPGLRFTSVYSWDELRNLHIVWSRQKEFVDGDRLELAFENGGMVPLKLRHLNRRDLERFFIAFESCATRCERDGELVDLEECVQAGEEYRLTETKIWEKSLSQRFSGATFIPLDPDSTLQSGRYRILRQLAFGGFSAVYLAADSGASVVLKESCFPKTSAAQDKTPELFEREASILSKLAHERIAKLNDYFVEAGRHYLVMEHVAGPELSRLVRMNRPMPPQSIRPIARQIIEALIFLHDQSPPVVHRDLTPDNIILRNDGSITLIDFGAAKEIANEFTGTIIGKQAYMAPEQFRGKPSTKSDIYGFGATLYFLWSGQQPKPLTRCEIVEDVAAADVSLRDLILRCTEQDENMRPDSTEVMQILKQSEEKLEPVVLTETVEGASNE